MKRKRCLALLILIAAVALLGAVNAGAMAGYAIAWSTVDGGAGFSDGGGYQLAGVIGQPDTGVSTGGAYRLSGGFWGGGEAARSDGYSVYLPLIVR